MHRLALFFRTIRQGFRITVMGRCLGGASSSQVARCAGHSTPEPSDTASVCLIFPALSDNVVAGFVTAGERRTHPFEAEDFS